MTVSSPRFATVAKQVDVRKLKQCLWTNIDQERTESSEEMEAGMSFKQIMRSVAEEQKQEGVTLPFYFICVLHLANEKVHIKIVSWIQQVTCSPQGLRLEGDEELSDFRIF
jgi:hypothetical protein